MPVCHQEKKDSQPFFSAHHNKKHFFHSPISGDPWGGGSGDSHFSWVRANEPPLGSTIGPRQGVVGGLSDRIWATPSILAPPSFACSWCKNSAPKTWSLLGLRRATRCQTVCSGDPLAPRSPWWQRQAWMWPLRSVPPYSSVPWTNQPLAPGPFFHRRKKCTHVGYPLESPLVFTIPTWCLSTNQRLPTRL